MMTLAKGWQEFWAEFFRVKHRRNIEGIEDWDRKLVAHATAILGLREGSRVLDLGCGTGDHARRLAARGISVVGVEIAKVLVRIGNTQAKEAGLPVSLIQGDMREVDFRSEFDACLMVNAFGTFEDDDNLLVLMKVKEALKSGGSFYIHEANPVHRISKKWEKWDRVEDGHLLMKSKYDPQSGTETFDFMYLTERGQRIVFAAKPEDKGVSMQGKIYTLPETIRLIETAGLSFTGAYGSIELPPQDYSIDSENLIIIGTKY